MASACRRECLRGSALAAAKFELRRVGSPNPLKRLEEKSGGKRKTTLPRRRAARASECSRETAACSTGVRLRMKLVLFRTLVHTRGCPAARLSTLSSSFDGVELSLGQLTARAVDACERAALRISCHISLEPEEDEARLQLAQLTSVLATHRGVEPLLETVIFSADASGDASDLVARLSDSSSRGARFLEEHPLVGSAHGKVNAHGRPLGNHVFGVCHALRGARPLLLSELVETLPPLRMALGADNLGAGDREAEQQLPSVGLGVTEELEAVVGAADHLRIAADDPAWATAVWQEVWCQQQADGAREAYATCEAGASDEAAERLARDLRCRFDASVEWRHGARARRDADLTESARAALEALSKDVLAAAGSFGLGADEARQAVAVEARWRALAKQLHPDVPGGSDDRFREMRAHYEVLMEDCRRRAPGFVPTRLPNARRR